MRWKEEIESVARFLDQMAGIGEAIGDKRTASYSEVARKVGEALPWAAGEDNDFGQMLEACAKLQAQRSAKQ